MGIIKRQGIKGIVVQYAGVFLGIITSVFIMPNCLSKEELGLTRNLTTLMIILSQASLLGTVHRVVKFSPFFPERRDIARFNRHNLKILLLGCLIISALLVIFRGPVIAYFAHDKEMVSKYFYLLIPLIFFQSLISIFDIFANTKLRLAVPVLLKEVVQKLLLILAILLYYLHVINQGGYFIFFLLTYVLICIGFALYLKRLQVPLWSNEKTTFSAGFGKEQRVFMYTSYLFTLLATLQANIDQLIVPGLMDFKALSIYSTILFFANMIQVPYRSISAISLPVIAMAWKDNDVDKINHIYHKSALNLLLAAAFIFILGWVNIHSLLALFPAGFIPENLKTTAPWLFFVLGMAKILDSGLGLNSEVLEKSAFYKANVLIVIINILISVFLYWYLTPRYGLIGIAMGLGINLLLCNLMRIAFIYMKWKISPFSISYLKIWLITGVFLFAGYFIPRYGNPFISIILTSAITSLIFLGIAIKLRLSEDVNEIYKKLVNGELLSLKKLKSR